MRSSVLFVALVLSVLSYGQKNVLFEKFTNAYCGVCPDATLNLIDITTEYPDVIWISHHKPVTWTNNPLTNEQSIALWDELKVAGVPSGMIDRKQYNGDITLSRNAWRQRVETKRMEQTLFDISISDVVYDSPSRTITFKANTKVLAQPEASSYRITAYIVEDSVETTEQHSYWNEVPGHPLEGRGKIIWDYHHRNVVRAILENPWGVKGVIPDDPKEGETYSKTFRYVIPEEYDLDNMQLVVQVATFDEAQNYPLEVQDAARAYIDVATLTTTSTSNIDEIVFHLSPNPTTDLLKVSFQKTPSQLMVLDASGKVVINTNPTGSNATLDVSSLQVGSYYLVAEIEGQLRGKTFVKLQ